MKYGCCNNGYKSRNVLVTTATRIQHFLRSKGTNMFEDQFNVDGSGPDFILQAGSEKKHQHSVGLVTTVASTKLISNPDKKFDVMHALRNERLQPYEDGDFDSYFDGRLYLFSPMHLSGKYQMIKPQFQ